MKDTNCKLQSDNMIDNTFVGQIQNTLEFARSLTKAKNSLKQKVYNISDKFTGSLIIDFHDNLYLRTSIKDKNGEIHTVDEFGDNLKRMFGVKC